MKGCRIKFSVTLLLELLGLSNREQLIVTQAYAHPDCDTVELVLMGDHENLPELKAGELIPEAIIIAENKDSKVESHIEIR